jgi:hypothetical protein
VIFVRILRFTSIESADMVMVFPDGVRPAPFEMDARLWQHPPPRLIGGEGTEDSR